MTNNTHQRINPFSVAQEQLREGAGVLNLSSNELAVLSTPLREFHFSILVRMDNGELKMFQGFRVQYNDALGPTKGGIRFHPDETIDTIRALAAWMTWKCSLLGLPLGGAKGGVICNPKEMSLGELERLSRGYIRALWQNIGPDKDVPAPDVYTTPQMMAWMMDEYSKLVGKNQFGVITGKPVAVGGSLGRGEATGRGGAYVIREAAKEKGIDLGNATVAVQGFGNVGHHVAHLLNSLYNAKIVAVSDSRGGIYYADGLDLGLVLSHKEKTGSVVDFPGAQNISNKEIFELGVDILIPAALEGVITNENANAIKAKIVAEMANGPTTPEADVILYKNSVHLIPDFLCNAGGVTVSYFEMVQNASMYYWTEKEVQDRLDEKMTRAYHEVSSAAKEYGIHMRLAAYVVAVKRVVEAMRLRGWV